MCFLDVPMNPPPEAPSKRPPRLFLDRFAGAHCPLTNAVPGMGLDAFALFDFALHATHGILDDGVMHLLLRLAYSGLVGMAWCTALQRFLQAEIKTTKPQSTAHP